MTRLKEEARLYRLPRAYNKCQTCRHFRKSLTDGTDFVNGNFCRHLPDIYPFTRKSTIRKDFKVSECNLYGKRDPKVITYIGEVSPFVGEV
jgi:hypothetical protein